MVIIMNPDATAENIKAVIEAVQSVGLAAKVMEGTQQKIVGVLGDKTKLGSMAIDAMEGVEQSVAISKSYKLVSREFHPMSSVIDVSGVKIGGDEPVIMAGPCAVESRNQLLEAAEIAAKGGAQFLRGGAYKPRTSPYSFQGLEEEGLKYLDEARSKYGLKIVTEVTEVEAVKPVSDFADLLQIGARNMQNFRLLKEVGRSNRPVMLKRGLAATLDEWLNAAEYIMAEGNQKVIFCERGIRTYETYTRNTLDMSAVPAIKHLSHLPIIVDPSHGTGKWRMIKPMSLAAIAAGADGLIIEMHPNPAKALSDGPQSITPEHYYETMTAISKLAKFLKDEGINPLND
ncbi:3-deoxy-7-phosphoheptulonate synthase [Selenomonas sp. TAMA-11512]|uniref:3-deoxy-7-phosphoheptulonate synthase n=1 Tax=Selenomonas sp. TAMA-11512 TaxID=3095337 RepID=UPI00308F3061|nr:3-deoxy-7-phosphoheptulonate synthase [Selenomonas sp. TAMA-11512]